MEIKQYAPVIIPTLNRYEHFKRCLDSLEKCTGANKTDVYVGLDYPPSEKYVEGWKKIDAYLAEKEKSNGFKNLFVRRRDHNLGIGHPGSNDNVLCQEVVAVSDKYIFSEDDNEFSPNFLEYVNCGLEKYKDNVKVCAVSGYLFPEINLDKSSQCFLSNFSNAWGTGYWVHHTMEYVKIGPAKYVNMILKSWSTSLKLYSLRAASLNGFLSMHFRNEYYGDVLKSTEMLLCDKFTLYPVVSKVRNWGHDGSGIHCSTSDKYVKQKIDKTTFFKIDEEPQIVNIAKYLDFPFWKRIGVFIRYVGYRLTGKDWMSFFWKL